MKKNSISRKLSYILRWNPDNFNIKLSSDGYAPVDKILEILNISLKELEYVVDNNDKKRFGFNKNKTLIRARQGHSKKLKLDIKYKEVNPPHKLYHGTSDLNLDSIKKKGLIPLKRDYVHLSKDIETAKKVGSRQKGNLVILEIKSKLMYFEGEKIYLSENGVYLTKKVNPKYINIV